MVRVDEGSQAKKLIGAAEWWGQGVCGATRKPARPAVPDEVADDMKLLGLQDEIAHVPREAEVGAETYEVWSDNLPTLQLFLRLENKWNVTFAPDGELIRTGIWFQNIEGVLRTTNGIPKRKWPEVIADLEAMEDAALEAMHKVQGERRERRLKDMQAKYPK